MGSKQAIGAGSDGTLALNESVTVQFRVGLATRNRFSFLVDIEGYAFVATPVALFSFAYHFLRWRIVGVVCIPVAKTPLTLQSAAF